jgi:hypothetical protein
MNNNSASSRASVSVDANPMLMLGNVQIHFIQPDTIGANNLMVRIEFSMPESQTYLLDALQKLPISAQTDYYMPCDATLSSIEVTAKSVRFTELNLEAALCPQELIFYIIFLLYSKEGGLKVRDLKTDKIKTKLQDIYSTIRPVMEKKDIDICIDNLTKPNNNRIYELISNINKKIRIVLPEDIGKYYCILGDKNEEKTILAAKYITIKSCATFRVPL